MLHMIISLTKEILTYISDPDFNIIWL